MLLFQAKRRCGDLAAMGRSENERKEDKRIDAEMRRKTSELNPEQLAAWAATKGSHAKRQKLRELYMQNGHDMGMTLKLFTEETHLDVKSKSQKWTPMTMSELKKKFGEEAAQVIADDCEKTGQYEVQPACPENKLAWMYKVYTGEESATGQETRSSTVMRIGGCAGSSSEMAAVMPELEKSFNFETPTKPAAKKKPRSTSGGAVTRRPPTKKAKDEPAPDCIQKTVAFLKKADKGKKSLDNVVENLEKAEGGEGMLKKLKPVIGRIRDSTLKLKDLVTKGGKPQDAITWCTDLNDDLHDNVTSHWTKLAKKFLKSASPGTPQQQ